MRIVRLMSLLFLLAGVWNIAPAQETKTGPAAGPTAGQSTPKKVNERPAVAQTQPSDPFDKATVEQMAAQCVTLDTEAGTIVLEMLPESAPESVRNFLNLTAIGAFDTTTFSRVVKNFVVQGGNLTTRQTLTLELLQRAKRTVIDEPSLIKHVRGIVSMARTDQPNSATTHFFIVVNDAPHLDGTFAAFGRVVRGMDVVDQINRAPAEGEKPLKPVRVTRATVAACGASSGGTKS